jgi:hypothetical protein
MGAVKRAISLQRLLRQYLYFVQYSKKTEYRELALEQLSERAYI